MQAGKNILLVEDDAFLGRLLKEKFEQQKFSVTLAVTGKEALERVQQKPTPKLVLLDLILPEVDGFEVLRQIRTHTDQEIAKMPVVVISNLGSQSDVDRARDLGATDYLVKAHLTPAEIVEQVCRY
ncbi:MAG: response regulator [Patescibacteria group bacterium]|nr:response regulator [Patescibacteria group bacterium]